MRVDISGLSFSRGHRPIFDQVSLQIPRHRITGVMGPSGTGKTTLLRLICGQLYPDAGSVQVDGVDLSTLSRQQLMHWRRKVGVLFQSGALFTHLNVFDNVAFPLRQHSALAEALIRSIVLMKLHAVGLRGAVQLMPAQLSGGMARRVALARAIALDPELVLYDEPFAGQDPIAKGIIADLILRLNKALGLTSIIVSHDVEETLHVADQIYILSGGKVVASGSPQAVRTEESPRVQQFIRGLPDGAVPFHYPAIDFAENFLVQEHGV